MQNMEPKVGIMGFIEKWFEQGLWSSRLIVFTAVIFSLVGSIILFLVASLDIYNVAVNVINVLITHEHPKDFHEQILGGIILAIDLYLIAVVLLIFSFGLYELFISKIDAAHESNGVLEIENLDQLKDKLAKVIVMVLIVSFFNKVLHLNIGNSLDMLYYALSILALSGGLYLLHKGGGEHSAKESH